MIYGANYALAVKTVVEVLEDYEITQAPINLQIIFEGLGRELRVKTYEAFMQESDMSLEEVILFFDSDLGACCYDSQTGRYVIFYNDSKSEAFIRFTLAHELGHIFLGHHQKAGTAILGRSFLSKEQYEEYEKEANVFARNLLSPAPLAWRVIEEGKSTNQNNDIANAFNVTSIAAGVRVNMIRRDLRDYSPEMQKKVNRIKIRYHKHCNKCKRWLPKESRYCMFCGNSRLSKSLSYKDFPDEIYADKNGFFIQCPTCGHADHDVSSRYCIICSTPLMNLCNGNSKNGKSHKRHRNRSFSMYCEECGAPTYYNEHNIEIRQEVSEMFFNDGVDFDEETLRVNICPVCGNEEFREEATFCKICGTNLYNECEGIPDQDMYGETIYINTHRNPSNARYCEICGKPTYFLKNRILTDYKTYLANKEAEEAFIANIPASTNVSDDNEDPFADFDEELPFN
ncbi:MAG: ImmA/IrrE family metallo-endopeptidase [Clostridiales bacterium]|nr:ImmA/IrrE family metallo-endopeptidase [Clostridiales bacterium]